MTVRWKPLLFLSGLFAVVAFVGLAAMALTLVPRRSGDILPAARAERAAGQFEKAVIHYKRALQMDGKNPSIHEEMAAMYAEWAGRAAAEKRAELHGLRVASLAEAARYGKALKAPRRQLLDAAMRQDERPESVHWANEVLALEPESGDAHYVLALEGLADRTPVVPVVKRHLEAMEASKAAEVRVALVRARLAQATADVPARDAALERARAITLAADAGPVDRMALVQLRALDVETTKDASRLAERVKALQAESRAVAAGDDAPNRIMALCRVLEQVQKSLTTTLFQGDPSVRARVDVLVGSIEEEFEAIFKRSTAATNRTDPHIYFTYADHLRYRGKRDRCLEVVNEGLKSPLARLTTAGDVVLGLHAVAVEAALVDTNDAARFEKAAPHIKELIASSSPRFQGFGHLFQGAIELEQSGVAGTPGREGEPNLKPNPAPPKLRASAVNHLKIAAEQLPDTVEAQARYGVALILSQEPSLGRQYLSKAIRQGNAEPQYQIWAAWSVVQAGYPEEAEPIVKHLSNELARGRMPRDLEGTLHLLAGEIYQARRTPEDLRKALAEYARSADGKAPPAPVQLRMAQIDVQLGQTDQALKRIKDLRDRGQGGTGAEHLAVITLLEQGKKAEAFATLARARARHPRSEELVGLDAALLARAGKPKEADRVLAEFLVREPDNTNVLMMRAQVLSDVLDEPKAARKLLIDVADRTENSAPLVQLALLDLRQKDYEAVAATIAKIRSRWKEAAAADLLEAQLAIDQGNTSEAAAHFDAALAKDPGNKVVQFWKAQLETRAGESGEAVRAFESLARDGSSKQLDTGLTLAAAAKSALANLSLQNGDVEGAIRRFEGLRSGGDPGGLVRGDRWQLIAAYVAKNQWPIARKEIAALLNDPKAPPSLDERVRAANIYRLNDETGAAVAQLDYVLGVNPSHPSAVVTRAYMLSEDKKTAEAVALLRKAIAAPQKDKPPAVFFLVLAALENISPPRADAAGRATIVLDQGLAARPKTPELVQAKYQLLQLSRGPKEAVEFVEAEAKDDPSGALRRTLADVYREQRDYEGAARVLGELVAKNSKDPALAASLVRVTALQSIQAGERNDRDTEHALNEKIAGLVREYRARFPNTSAFLEEECELAYRRGDISRATAVTAEIDKVAKNSPAGPLLRARLYAAQGRTRESADAYAEAIRRNPRQPEVRLMLGQASLKLGETDEAIRQARFVRESDGNRVDAVLLEARALAQADGPPAAVASRRSQAVEMLSSVIKRQPKIPAVYHQIAEIRLAQNEKEAALTTLRAGVEAVPTDTLGFALLIELLAGPARPGGGPAPEKLAAAEAMAKSVGDADASGGMALAAAVGFHKAGQVEPAEAWVARASAKLDAPVLHLNYGDILMSHAERSKDPEEARRFFRKAVDEYDLVLKTQANSVEAVNNKAWILHTYLGESKKALQLARGLLARLDPSTLPGEFFDTLGAIQESMGDLREAESSYSKGLRKSPAHPVLNLHMGKLILADATRTAKARGYLEKAYAGRDKLNPTMAAEVDSLMVKAQRN